MNGIRTVKSYVSEFNEKTQSRRVISMKIVSVIAIVLILVLGCVSAKDIVISDGISLTDTTENLTHSPKLVVADLSTAPERSDMLLKDESVVGKMVALGEDITGSSKEYSTSPVSVAISEIETPEDRAAYKAEYISMYSDIVGTNVVTIDGRTVEITVESVSYDESKTLLQLNMTASVDGVSKVIHNPYKIYNPPILVQVTPNTYFPNGTLESRGNFVEDPDSCILQVLSEQIIKLDDGNPTFDGIDPVLVVYALSLDNGRNSTLSNSSVSSTYLPTLIGAGNSAIDGSTSYAALGNSSSKYYNYRIPLSFDTSSISGFGSISITNASANFYGSTKLDAAGISPSLSITSFSPTSHSVVRRSDYSRNGTGLTRFSGDIPYSSFSTSGYNTMYFTSTGISQINTSSYTDMMVRTNRDVDSISTISTSVGSTGFIIFNSNQTGTSQDPYLSITYAYPGYDTQSDFTTDEQIVISGATVTFTPHATAIHGGSLNWSFGDGTWSNVSSTVPQTHSYTGPRIVSPGLYIFNSSAGTIVNSTVKTEYVGVDSYKYYAAIDGNVGRSTPQTWANTRGGSGEYANEFISSLATGLSADSTPSQYLYFERGIQTYNTNGFPTGYTITNASVNIEGNFKDNTFAEASSLGLTGISSMSSDTNISIGDFDNFEDTILSGNITTSAWNDAGYNKLYLTSLGKSEFNRSGYTRFMVRNTWDTDNKEPTWVDSRYMYFGFNGEQGSSYMIVNYSASSVYFTASPTVGLVGSNTIQFQDESSPYGATWNWSFGDGTYSSSQNATHSYTSVGLYNVTLTSPVGGSSYTRTNYINISAPNFYCTPLVSSSVPHSVDCYDTSAVITGSNRWLWGDTGITIDGPNVSHTYAASGDYNVSMQSPSIGGVTTTKINYIHVGQTAPTSDFTSNVTSIVSGDYVQFNDTTTGTPPSSWIWDFNGTTVSDSVLQNPTARFYNPGSYSINLTATNTVGTDSEVKVGYIIVSNPTASFTSNVTEVAAGGYVQFAGSTTGSTTPTWRWSFNGGTGNDSSIQNPIYQFNTVGNFSVNMTAYVAGGSDSEVKTNYIRVWPSGWVSGMTPITEVDFGITSGYTYGNTPFVVPFVGTATGHTLGAINYKWNFIDGGTSVQNSTSNTPSYTFTAGVTNTSVEVCEHIVPTCPSGYWCSADTTPYDVCHTDTTFSYADTTPYSVNFTASNAISSMSVVRQYYILVLGPGVPYAMFDAKPTSGTPGVLVSFNDKSVYGNTTGLVCNWSFGDGIYTTTPYSSICGDVKHVYTYGGVYDVNLSITNFNGTSFLKRNQYITVSTSQANTWYSPHQVSFKVMDMNNNVINNAHVNATVVASTLPGGIDGAAESLVNNYGITQVAADTMVDQAIHMEGYTGSDGKISFTMHGSLMYDVVVDGSNIISLYPMDTLYNYYVTSSSYTAPQNEVNYIRDDVSQNLTFSEPNQSYMTLGVSYQDFSGRTDYIQFWVKNVQNNTVIYSNNRSVSGTELVLINKTIKNNRGDQWRWMYDAHHV